MSEQREPGNGSVEALLGQVADEFTDRINRGERPDVEDYARRYPEMAAILRQVLPALQVMGPGSAPVEPGRAQAADEGRVAGYLGDFRMIREVGRGGMGIVYEAEQVSLGRRVALKVLPFAATLDPRQLQRFHNEARAAAGLHHTNIVPVHGVGCEHGVHYYAMRFIDGRTLADFIAQQRGEKPSAGAAAASAPTVPAAAQATSAAPRGAAYFRRVAEWGVQAAEALDCAHSLGVVHRDVKPANLLVDAAGQLWVTDFGLAQVQSDPRLTATGDLVGTLRYMSPEQALAQRAVIDHRTDVYSLGATLYELLTLEPAFGGTDRQELLRQIAFEEPQRPRRQDRVIPAELETIVLKAIEKLPHDRYATAKEMADDLRRFLEDKPISARRPSVVQRLLRWSKRHQAALMTACLFLLVMVIGLAVGSVLLWREKIETGKALTRAEEQERLANANAARANAQRTRAELNLDWSLNAIHHVLAKLDGEEFSELSAAPDVRRRLTVHAVRVFREHMDESSADPAVRQDTARLYGAIALLHSGQGDHAKARAAFEKVAAILKALTIDCPDNSTIWRQLGHTCFFMGEELESLGLTNKAAEERRRSSEVFCQAVRVDPNDASAWENWAWNLLNARDSGARDPARAVELASKAVALAPTRMGCWNTLGMAQYQTGNWEAAIYSLKKSMSLRDGDNSWNWYFLAMAHWRIGEKEEARRWYDKAVSWARTNNQADSRDLRQVGAEATQLLGITDSLAPEDKANSPR